MNWQKYTLRAFFALIVGLGCLLWANHTLAGEELTQEQLKPFEAAIRIHGYQCPCAAIGFYKGIGPRGQEFKIFCGPNETKVYPKLVYKVVLDPNMETVINSPENSKVWVEPWK